MQHCLGTKDMPVTWYVMLSLLRKNPKYLKNTALFNFWTVKLILLTVVDIKNHVSGMSLKLRQFCIKWDPISFFGNYVIIYHLMQYCLGIVTWFLVLLLLRWRVTEGSQAMTIFGSLSIGSCDKAESQSIQLKSQNRVTPETGQSYTDVTPSHRVDSLQCHRAKP